MRVPIESYRHNVDQTWYCGVDLGQQGESCWNKAPLRVLVVFLSTGNLRSESSTYSFLDALIKKVNPEVFVDYSIFPATEDFNFFKKKKIPFIFGNVSKRTADEYDLVFFSFSIIGEVLNYFYALKNSGIPVWVRDRVTINKFPLFIGGGIIADALECLHGGYGGAIELMAIGHGEGIINYIIEAGLKYKAECENIRKPDVKVRLVRYLCHHPSIYFPQGYNVVYQGIELKEISRKPLNDWVNPEIIFNEIDDMTKYPLSRKKIFTPDGRNARTTDIMISTGCNSFGLCTFCFEGHRSWKGWQEYPYEKLRKYARDCLKYSAGNSGALYSFNANYYSRFLDALNILAKTFSSTSTFTMRADVSAVIPEFFIGAKLLGLMRVSLGVEGLGERIRNNILNKNLSFDVLKQAVVNILKQDIVQLKLQYIVTGFETGDDLDEGYRELKEIMKIRDKLGVRVGLAVTFTFMVHYEQTPIQYLPRRVALTQASGKLFLYKFTKKIKKMGYRIKFNGWGYETVYQQILIDGGRQVTRALDRWADTQFYYNSDMPFKEGYRFARHIKDITGYTVSDFFKGAHSLDRVRLSDLYVASKLRSGEHLKSILEEKPQKSCLRTSANPVPKCYACGKCKTWKERDVIIERDIHSENNIHDILYSISQNRSRSFTRVSAVLDSRYDALSKKALAFRITSLFLQSSDSLLNTFHSVKTIYNTPLTSGDLKDWYSGKFIFEIGWKILNFIPGILDEMQSVMFRVNSMLTSTEIKEIIPIPVSPGNPAYVLWEFESHEPVRKIKEGLLRYDKNFYRKIKDKVVIFRQKELPLSKFKIMAYPSKGHKGSVGVLLCPYEVSPYVLFMKIFGRGVVRVYKNTYLKCLMIYGQTTTLCKCGELKRLDEFTREDSKICPACMFNFMVDKINNERRFL